MTKFGMGQSVRRVEDLRLVRGEGTYTDDIKLPAMVHAYMLRSPYAHARLLSIDTEEARAAPGVLAVYTAADLEAGGIGQVPCLARLKNRDGSDMFVPERRALARDTVRYAGESVAMIVADSVNAAKDAADLVYVDYEDLPVIADTEAAAASDAPVIYPEHGSNVLLDWAMGEEAAVDAALGEAAHVTRFKLVNNRLVVNAMEPRVAIAAFDAEQDHYTLYTPSQGVHLMRDTIAGLCLGIPPEKLRVVTDEVGGGFGMKSYVYPEHLAVLFAARALGRPVKWTGERSDAFLTDTHGRDHVSEVTLGFDAGARLMAIRVETVAALGAYASQFGPMIPTRAAPAMQVGVYDVQHIYEHVRCVATNTTPVDAYRGAGRPEAAYVIERGMDIAAQELGLDAAEIRRRNFIRPDQMPYRTAFGMTYDSGEFEANMDAALAAADWSGFEARRQSAREKGHYLGHGLAYYVEKTGAVPFENAEILVLPEGRVRIEVGTQSNGQGHETAWAQLSAEKLGIDISLIEVTDGDSDRLAGGGGTGGSRGLTMASGAIETAGDTLLDKGRAIAARELGLTDTEVIYRDGQFKGPGGSIDLFKVAGVAVAEANDAAVVGLVAEGRFEHKINTFPNGCHICEVAIEAATGTVRATRYIVVDDFGRVLNPLIVEGQVHGGIAQGLGQAMGEHAVYDPESGQLMAGSFMDYWMPRADDMPEISFTYREVPCTTNALGVKGCGEAGAIGAPPAFVNAVVDALRDYGVTHVDMPVTPQKVWRILNRDRAA